MGGYHAPQESHETEAERRKQCPGEIVIIIQEQDRRIHQEQDEISRRHTGIDPHDHSSESILRQKHDAEQIYHHGDDELDPHKTHQLIGNGPEHPAFRIVDIGPLAADDGLGICPVFVMKMHLDPRYEYDRRRNIGKHSNTGCHIIGLVTHETLDDDNPHIRRPEDEIMDIKSQNIQEIRGYQLPPFAEIFQYRFVTAAVLHKITFDGRKLHDPDQEEPDCQGKQNADRNFPPEQELQDQRKDESDHHADQEIEGYLLIVLTDRQIEHRVEYEYQRDITAESRKHIEYAYLPHEVLPQAERNTQKATEYDIKHQTQVVARQDILIPFLEDSVLHILGQHGVERRRRQ